jgi:hypothetical protein
LHPNAAATKNKKGRQIIGAPFYCNDVYCVGAGLAPPGHRVLLQINRSAIPADPHDEAK